MQKIIKNFNKLIKKTIFNVQNKTKNNFNISSFNKYLIIFISLLFFYLFYLLTPLLYEKNWVQNSIEKKLLNEFRINLSTSADITYRILPAPHFLIKDSKIFINSKAELKSIAEIKDLKVFLNQRNFLNKEKMHIKKISIYNANFSLTKNDLKILNESTNNQFSNKKIKIIKSNVFFKDESDKIIAISKINKATIFFNNKISSNLLNLKGEIYGIPFTFEFKIKKDSVTTKEIKFEAKSLKLKIFNTNNKEKNNHVSGKNIISFFNSIIDTNYNIKDQLIIFSSVNSKVKNFQSQYNGEISINPFDLNLNIDLGNYKISKLFNTNSILTEFIKSELLFNENISMNTSIIAYSEVKNEIFQQAKINFNIINGKINFDKTKFINNKIVLLKLNNSNLFFENNNLILNTDILINIENADNLFSFLNTGKSFRNNIKDILINVDYNLSTNKIEFNNIEIDKKKASEELMLIVASFDTQSFKNLNISRRLLNILLQAYEG